ncbi:MAG TPA: precorrin-3B C(17)-methyltransferase [Amaricoccus sp.]|uniref:precorrin-3B C(17)-methyltransferase n=2 Tax=Amaricoccus sp. TaxID=1872485 RepID=UPI002C475DE6|nr:precorrin-3B C(17)-methyltransferase [Amaricoccus sp.]HMR52062.1 precorrin-3B C(17)-methyltransferase [Amaricoccus sp.]HMR61853.1 precorrin-3B C(17)-methyltransferase [Amaricoccus sp.]HMT98864.1 precorrin-3B C(17)-methyltransferase [Amaricoccus sp.]
MRPEPVVVTLDPSDALADRIAAAVEARLHARGRDFTETGAHLRGLFLAGHPVIGLCAAGILIRSLAPVLASKADEPPVLAVAEDGSAVVPLLGGHHGANDLARRIAQALASLPAITTAGDLALGVALDAPPPGWRLENPEHAKPVMAALIRGAPASLSGEAPWLAPLLGREGITARPAPVGDAPVVLRLEDGPALVWRRQTLALGVGCVRGCDPGELIGLVQRSLAEAGRSVFEVAGIWSVELKADEAAVHALAGNLGVPARFFSPERLEAETPRLADPSEVVFAEIGCHGVSEAAALAAAGPDGALVLAKRKSANATCALATLGTGPEPGRPRGRLAVVGIGPGRPDWRTPEASRLIAEADELVGYGLYLDLLGPIAAGRRRDFPLGAEADRCRYALESAGAGRSVALISSGDGGIYAMGALVMELLALPPEEGGVSAAARRVEVLHAPGISALQAASARAGALLGHDFCAISLSDLLTPRETILARIRAAAAGDFVIAFYNPVSQRRRVLLDAAREILLDHRAADTPVLLASNLGRADETLRVRTLATLRTEEVDMLTLVLVGSSATRAFPSGDGAAGAGGQWLFTPRGYAAGRIEVPA